MSPPTDAKRTGALAEPVSGFADEVLDRLVEAASTLAVVEATAESPRSVWVTAPWTPGIAERVAAPRSAWTGPTAQNARA